MATKNVSVVTPETPVEVATGTVVMPVSSKDAERLQKLFAGWSGMNAGQRNAFKGMVTRILDPKNNVTDGLAVATALKIQQELDAIAPPSKGKSHRNGGATPAHFQRQLEKWEQLSGREQAGVKAALTKALKAAPPETKEQLAALQEKILAAPSNAKGKAKGTSRDLAQLYLQEGIEGYRKLSLWSRPARKARVSVEAKKAEAQGDNETARALRALYAQM